ncbi:MAG: alpha-D-glucose phosphate-specific phosphoglucomutase [Ectothiorhodospiraceae bacterium]|nr:alpha-D-glucose phosphate-specific phosphoglucomutase [Ectothiorhodospiraceae bacterium]
MRPHGQACVCSAAPIASSSGHLEAPRGNDVPNHPRAGEHARAADLVDPAALERAYFERAPDPTDPTQRVAFGTSGHRGSALDGTFNEQHILAITQAVCEYRREQGIDGPVFVGRDTHAVSAPALDSVLEVLAGNAVVAHVDAAGGFTPTPVVSHAILGWNRSASGGTADGILLTPSHNPPADGGIKYNPPHGGPADTDATRWIEARANTLIAGGLHEVARATPRGDSTVAHDYVGSYVGDLAAVIDADAIRGSALRVAVDPMGGAAVDYWGHVSERLGIDIEVVNRDVDPRFGFMTLDWDGKVRMDCSSPYAMRGLIDVRERFDLAFANDPDVDRHGIVTRAGGLMNPNHYLAVAVSYLFANRPGWRSDAGVGKTVVSSAIIDRVAADLGRPLVEVPVGFKWFVEGLRSGRLGFGGEESAGASFVRRDGSVWTTDKDGIILGLLAIEMTARTGRDPALAYADITARLGEPAYARIDAAATPQMKAALGRLSPSDVKASTLAGDPIRAMLTRAPGNDAAIGGLKVVTDHGWFAARPSGTEAVYKLYAESFRGPEHLARIQEEAQAILATVL